MISFEKELARFQARLTTLGKSPKTIIQYSHTAKEFIEHTNKTLDKITPEDLDQFIAYKLEKAEQRRTDNEPEKGRITTEHNRFNPKTIKLYFVAIKSFLEINDQFETSRKIKLPTTLAWIPNHTIERKDLEQTIDIRNVEENYENSKTKNKEFYIWRDWSILTFIVDTGARINEVQLKKDGLKLDRKVPAVVLSSKNHTRIVEVSDTWLGYLKKYLSLCRFESEYVFCTQTGARLSIDSMKKIVKRHTGFSPHKFRHFYAIAVTESDGIKKAQERLGHASLSTTAIYLSLVRTSDDRVVSPLKRLEEQSE